MAVFRASLPPHRPLASTIRFFPVKTPNPIVLIIWASPRHPGEDIGTPRQGWPITRDP